MKHFNKLDYTSSVYTKVKKVVNSLTCKLNKSNTYQG